MSDRRRRWARWALRLLVVVAVVGGALSLAAYVQVIRPIDREVAALPEWRPAAACEVFDRRGQRIDRFYVERREWVPIDELPAVAWQAVLAAEDRRFLEHPGVDLQGIARAVWVNMQAGEIREGGSTLTQQIAKNLVVGDERSYTRKLREAVVAWRMEQTLSKLQILEIYLNFVYLGSGNYGIEAAAQDYFGISARQLDAGQAALIAGLIPAPTHYSPRRRPEQAAQRRRIVLNAMMQEGYITAEEVAELNARDIDPPPRVSTQPGAPGAAYITAVRREVRQRLGREQAFAVGLQVYTPYDADLQLLAEASIAAAVQGVVARRGLEGPRRRLDAEQLGRFLVDKAAPDTAPGTCFEVAVLADRTVGRGPWRGALPRSEWQRLVRGGGPSEPSRSLAVAARTGDVLEVCVNDSGDGLLLSETPWLDGAAVVIENETGHILAMAGGIGAQLEGFNLATQARRQPGSSFKPFVYAAALLRGQTQLDRVVDAPLALPGGNGTVWRPQNYSGGFRGAMPMRDALAASLNTVAVRLVLDSGPEAVIAVARDLGVTAPLREDITLALGSSEVSVLDQATAYSSLARMGVFIPPSTIRRLETAEGEPVVLGDAPPARQALPAPVAYEVVDMLRGVVQRGTARRARAPGLDRAGKTGTTNDFVDAWFVGITPRHSIAVWVGANDRRGLGPGETGGRAALPAWIALAEAAGEAPGERFPVPDGVALLYEGGDWIGVPRSAVPAARLPRPAVSASAPLPDFPSPGHR